MSPGPRRSGPEQGLLPGTPPPPEGPDAAWGHEERAWSSGRRAVAGLDEVGRGALAGPVVVAAVVFPPRTCMEGLRDSKGLSPARRHELAAVIRERADAWCLASADVGEVDRLDVLGATLLAMRRAVAGLGLRPDLLLLDAVRMPGIDIPQKRLVRGDRQCASIAAASILAKVERDQRMVEFDRTYPYYDFGENKGYGTPTHLEALEDRGPSPIHRQSFRRVTRRGRAQDSLLA